jgi:hypothetical protein
MLETDIPRYAMVAHAELGEVRRRRGDLAGALEAFQNALELGWDPQPGLALLLLEQGDPVAAHRALERMFVEPVSTYICEDRSGLLAARTTVALAAGEPAIAEQAAGELEGLAAHNDTLWDAAAAAQARGEVEHARGRVSEAARHYTRAHAAWAELEVPFELARTRAALGRALAADGDRRGAQLEMGAAERIFARIGATRERDRVAACLAELTAASGTKGGPAAASSSPGAGSGAGAGAGSGAGAGAGSGAGAGAGADAQAREARLACEGDYWSLSWGGNVVRLRDGRGPRYLAALLARPGVDQWSIELARDTAADPGEARSVRMAAAGDVEAERTTAAGLGDAGEFLDDEARAAYRCRLEDLRHDLDQARDRDDADAAETILCEMHQLGSSLAAAVGLGGRSRRAGSAAERARQSVSKALRATVRKVAATDSWLGHYLKATVSTGTACRFDPDPRHPVHWLVEVS